MKRIILFFGALLINLISLAQQNSSKLYKYPKSIIIKLYDISQKTKLSDDKEKTLAEEYLRIENELAKAITSKASRNEISSIRSNFNNALLKKFTPQEVEQFNKETYVNDGLMHVTTSKFYSAYKYAKELKLTTVQLDSIVSNGIRFEEAMANFVSYDNGKKFDAQGYENKILPKILNEKQFNFLFAVKYKDISSNQAITDWSEAKKRGLTKDLDSSTVVPTMIAYNMERKAIGERYKSDPAKRNEMYAILEESVPEISSKLKYARRYGSPLDEKGNVSKSSY